MPAKDQVAAIPLEKLVAQSSGSESPIVYLKDVVCYLSLLETGRPQDKLECKYSPCQGASTFFLEEDLSSCSSFQTFWRLFWDQGYGSQLLGGGFSALSPAVIWTCPRVNSGVQYQLYREWDVHLRPWYWEPGFRKGRDLCRGSRHPSFAGRTSWKPTTKKLLPPLSREDIQASVFLSLIGAQVTL